MAVVWIPPQLRYIAGGSEQVTVPGDTLARVIEALEGAHPGFRDLLTDGGALRPSISVAVDGEVTQRGLTQPVAPNSEIQIVPAIAGGR